MNAPLKATVGTIETFTNLLAEDFVKETIERQDLINHVRASSKESLKEISTSNEQMANSFKSIAHNFSEMEDKFGDLHRVYQKNQAAFDYLARAAKELTENLSKSARQIRENSHTSLLPSKEK